MTAATVDLRFPGLHGFDLYRVEHVVGDVVKIKGKPKRKPKTEPRFVQLWGAAAGRAGFTQIPNALIERQAALGIDAVDFNILVQLLAHWWEPENFPFPSKARIAERVRRDPRTVQRRISAMQRDGLLLIRPGPGGRNTHDLSPLITLVDRASREVLAERERARAESDARVRRKRIAG